MFDRIAHRYDLLNRLLSGGTDVAWRKRMARHLPERANLNILDMATGTADVLLMMRRANPQVARGVGMDLSAGMLALGRDKIRKQGLSDRFCVVRTDATCVAAADNVFDAATIAFGIRNVTDVVRGLSEMTRVVVPGGRVLVLEFSLPKNRPFRALYLFYFRTILPRIGAWISGDAQAYSYLNQTVETFPHGEAFCALMRQAGLVEVKAFPLTFGIATLYQGDKPAA